MIISASRRTDIPAYYPEWFMNRVREQFFVRVNPFNQQQRRVVSLRPEDVDVIVFWTKNPEPLMKYLPILDGAGYRYYFQFTLNDYPKVIEPGLSPISQRIKTFKVLSETIGKERVVWRFDPIILSTATPLEFLQEKFAYLAAELRGYTERVMISFLDFYRKTASRAKAAARNHGITFYDITQPEFCRNLVRLVQSISESAARNDIKVYTCSETVDLSQYGILPGSCIDSQLIERVFGIQVSARKDRAQRPECLCVEAVDMGMYNTCPAGCVYCYASGSVQEMKRNAAQHDPTSPILSGKCDTVELPWNDSVKQLALF